MKRSGILNQPLSSTLASFGHGDMLIVSDVGFPIPSTVTRVDLAIAPDLPDLRTMLTLLSQEMFTEKVVIAAEMEEFNRPLYIWLREHFAGIDFETRPHAEMLGPVAASAKAIVRTGAFDPWGNIGLVSGVDVTRFFTSGGSIKEGIIVPDYYRERL